MFTSSEEYIRALHEGDILQFLEWPNWLTKHSLNQDCTQDADATLDLLRGEWLRCGYREEDSSHIAILYHLLNEENSLLQSIHEYSASALCGAAKQCMVYIDILKKNPTLKFTDPTLKPYQKNNQLLDETDEALKNLNKLQMAALNAARQRLKNLFLFRDMVSSYLLFLEKLKTENDPNLPIRIGLARSMKENLDARTKYDEICSNEIDIFVTTIRKLSPTPAEETEYLSYMLPIKEPIPISSFWKIIDLGCSFLFSSPDKTTNTEPLLLKDDEPSQNPNTL